MRDIGAPEILLIIGVIVLLFGGRKLPELARGSGRALRIFKSELRESEAEEKKSTAKPKSVERASAADATVADAEIVDEEPTQAKPAE